jgi:hypothetical protein
MKKQKAKFKFSAVFFGELEHKATITYDNTPEEQKLLDAILAKVLQTMPRTKALKTYNKICEKQKNCSSHKEFNDLEIAKYKKEHSKNWASILGSDDFDIVEEENTDFVGVDLSEV